MGFFSWKTSDTKESISNSHSSRGTRTVYMLLPNGEKIAEHSYQGYGVFGGIDAYQQLAEQNFPKELLEGLDYEDQRSIGIKLECAFRSFIDRQTGVQYVTSLELPFLKHFGLLRENHKSFEENNAGQIDWSRREEIKIQPMFPLKFSHSEYASYSNLQAAEGCEYQGFFYPEE